MVGLVAVLAVTRKKEGGIIMAEMPTEHDEMLEEAVVDFLHIMIETHIERHKSLHRAFSELVGDFFQHNPDKSPDNTIMELIKWSYRQISKPELDKT